VTLARGPFVSMVNTVARESHVPGYHLLLWLWVRAFGAGLPALRCVCVHPGGLPCVRRCRSFPVTASSCLQRAHSFFTWLSS
jgi:hypothetical protein